MRTLNRRVIALFVATIVLGVAGAVSHRQMRSQVASLGSNTDPVELSKIRVDEQYRSSARANALAYDVSVLAGSGARGTRDGFGLYAQFNDPIDVSVSPDGSRILVLDGGAGTVREILVHTRQVSTFATYAAIQGGRAHGELTRVVAVPGGAILVDANGNMVFRSADGLQQALLPAPDGPTNVSDVMFDDGRLFVLDGPRGDVKALTPGSWRWSHLATLPTGFDRICVSRSTLTVLSSRGGAWARFDYQGRRRDENPGPGQPIEQLLCDGVTGRYVGLGNGRLFAVSADRFTERPAPVTITNIEGRELGERDSTFAYDTTWMAGAKRIAFDSARNLFYVLDRPERRILRVLNSFGSWQYGPHAGNSHGFLSPEYAATKPAGTSRILWLSHSVFWDPAGTEINNLAVGAPRVLERILNERHPEAGRWEILNPGLIGNDFYTAAYRRTLDALATYGFDYVIVVMDVENFSWFLRSSGLGVPAAFSKDGIPDGLDAALTVQPVLERQQPPELQPLATYIKQHMVGTESQTPLFDSSGALLDGRFVLAWQQDPTFQALVIDAYLKLLRGLQKAATDAGATFTVFVGPTSGFVSAREWWDPYKIGLATDFEAAHRPMLERFWRAGIPAYDITYDMLSRHPQLFPFNAKSHHRSYLFHRAAAESIDAVIERFGIVPFTPQPARRPWGSRPATTPTAGSAIVTERGDTCFVLHDIWGSGRGPRIDPTFNNLLALGVRYVAATVDGAEYQCRTFQLTFANVKNRDDYGNRDFRDIEQVATMTIPVDQLEPLTQAVASHAPESAALMSAVHYEPRRR